MTIKNFAWGKVIKKHLIGEYMIIEYIETDTKETKFHPYINEKDSNTSYASLDEALIGCITRKCEGSNNHYLDKYIFRMLGI